MLDLTFTSGHEIGLAAWLVALILTVLWYVREVKLGRPLTIISLTILFSIFLPILFYPFALSPLNALTVGYNNYAQYMTVIDEALWIHLAGSVSLLVGVSSRIRLQAVRQSFNLVQKSTAALMNKYILGALFISVSMLIGLMGAVGLFGEGNARAVAMSNPAIRPIYNLYYVIINFAIVITSAAIVSGKIGKSYAVPIVFIYIIYASLSATRSAVLGSIASFIFAMLMVTSYSKTIKINMLGFFFKTALVIPFAVFIAIYMAEIREGRHSISGVFAVLTHSIFFGNTFSDLRDFSWILSRWNGEYFYGKTIISGMLSMLPSHLSEFRQEWGYGRVTTRIADLDSDIHPGLRGGHFAEMYLNFGPFMLLFAFLYGAIIGNISRILMAKLHGKSFSFSISYCVAAIFASQILGAFYNTAAFFTVYVLGGILLFATLLKIGSRAAPRISAP